MWLTDYATTAIKMASLSKDTIDSARSNELIFTNHLYEETITLKAQRDYTQMIQNDAITGVNGRSQTSVLQGNMSITIAQGALLAKAAKTITLQVGNTKLLIAPSGISLDATSIHINPASSGSAMPSQIIHQTLTRDDAQTKIDNAMQTDVGASKAASSKSNHEWEIKALAASMIIAIPFDTIFAGEVEQAAAGAEITSLEIEDLAADVASDEASSVETEDLGEETAEDLGAEPSEDLGERNESKWMDSDGNIKWLPNGGFDGEPKKQVLAIGTIIDRYGDDFGSFVSSHFCRLSSSSQNRWHLMM